MRATLVGAAAVMAVAGCALFEKPAPLHVFPVRHYDLPSGLRVAIEEDQTGGMVGVAWVIDAGMLDDPGSAPGVAHLVEHLLLRAPDGGSTPLEQRLAAVGAETNGLTTLDRTIFFAFVGSQSLDAAMALMAARLADPLRTADEALVRKEREVTAEEERLRRGIGSPLGLRAALAALTAPGQPFSQLGDFDGELRAKTTLADARSFVERHYRPSRMTLVISGPVSPTDDQRLLAALPAALQGRAEEPRLALRRPLIAQTLSPIPTTAIPAHVASVASPDLWMAWLLPPARGLASVPFEVLGGVVDHLLRNRLNERSLPDVLAAGCHVETSALGGALLCRLVLRPNTDPAAVKRRAGALVAELGRMGGAFLPSATRNATVWSVRGIALGSALEVEGLGRRLMIRANLAHEDPSTPLSSVLTAIERVEPRDVSDLAQRYLGETLGRAALLVPDSAAAGRGRPAPVQLARATAPAHGSEAADEGDAEDGGQDDLMPNGNLLDVARAPGAAAATTTRLANGLTVIALRRPGLPFTSMVLGFHAEPQPEDPRGIAAAAIYGRHHYNIASALQRGVRQDVTRGRDHYEETIAMFASDLPRGLRVLEDEAHTLTVRWPAPAFDRWVELSTLASGTPPSAPRARSRIPSGATTRTTDA